MTLILLIKIRILSDNICPFAFPHYLFCEEKSVKSLTSEQNLPESSGDLTCPTQIDH